MKFIAFWLSRGKGMEKDAKEGNSNLDLYI